MTFVHDFLRSLKARKAQLHARPDSEHEQAGIRILIAAIVWVYLWLTYAPEAATAHRQYLILWLLGVDTVLCTLLLVHIVRNPAVNRVRRIVGMVNDAGMCTLVMFLTGEAGASMIGLFLFITFGNGFRYGRPYLFACQALCLAGYSAVLLLHDHWQAHQTVGWSLMIALVVLPLYVSTLLKRIEQARARAEEANKAKSTFLANMSHEMRTPLNGIVGAIDLFRTTPLDTRQVELTRLLQHSVGMLRALVDDVLDIEKIEAGRLTIEIADFDLHGTLNGLINLLRPHARNKGLALSAMVDPAIDYRLCGDAHHLTQILLNLVSNAIKFTDKGSVEVSVAMKSETATGFVLRFEVRDSGIGISPEAQARIFERFVQADDSTTRRYGGTGLGTTIAKQLVELMGGRIGLSSTPGRGSTFWFEVPLLRATAVEAEVAEPAQLSSVAVVVAAEPEQLNIGPMVASVCAEYRTVDPANDVVGAIDQIRAGGKDVSAVFYSGDLERAHSVFNELSQDARNASTALIYVASAGEYAPASMALREIDGVNLIEQGAPPRHLRNAIHAATSKGSSLGQVIDLRTVLEEQRQQLRILVAEDNVTNQQIVRALLEKAGHTVVLAGDGEAALDAYEQETPDLAILDFNMPHRNGLEVTKAIRAMEAPDVHLPVMILSASVTPEARERARRAGVDEFVGKPYDAAVLLQTIDRMARRSRIAPRTAEQRPAAEEVAKGEVHVLPERAASLLDPRRLHDVQRIAGNSDFMSRLIAGFNADITGLLSTLEKQVARGELAAVGDTTHAMKGAALGIGAARLAALCEEVERLAAAGQLAPCRSALPRLRTCFEQTSVQLLDYPALVAQAASS
jgi:two-component system sensor histidine kinase RpfC